MYSFWLRNLLLPAALKRTRSRFLTTARAIRAHQFLPAERQRARQLEAVRCLVRWAHETCPFYRERFQGMGAPDQALRNLADLPRLGVLTKSEFQANFPDRVAAAGFRSPLWQYVGSRGTANRIIVIHDFERRDRGLAADLVGLSEDSPYALGRHAVFIPPDDCSTLCGPGGMRSTTPLRHLGQMLRQGRLGDREAQSDLRGLVMQRWIRRALVWESFGPEGTHPSAKQLDQYIDRLHASRPVLLKALPEYLRGLARHSRVTGRPLPRVPVVKPMGSLLASPVRDEIDQAFSTRTRSDYGSREMGTMAFDCRFRQGMHVLTDQFLIEVVRDGQPVPDGDLGQVLVTDLHNWATPLVRYQISDVGRLVTEPCPCGRLSPRLFVEGRLEDTLVGSSGRWFSSEMLARWLYALPGIDEFQLVEDSSGRLELKVVPRDGGPDAAGVIAGLRTLLGSEQRIVLRTVQTILPERSGKFRHVRSASFDRMSAGPALVYGCS